MKVPTISITTRRGRRCFRWKIKGIKRYRVIQPGNEDQQPLRKLKKPEVKAGKQRFRRDGLRPDEVETLVTTTAIDLERVVEGYDGTTRAWLYLMANVTGLRRGELAALTPDSFDWARKLLRLSGEFTKNGDDAECRLPTSILPGLRKWLSGHVGPLFPDLRIKRVCKMVARDLKAANLPVVTPLGRRTFHSLRNSFVSKLWALGVPGPTVQKLSRHSTQELAAAYDRSPVVDSSVIDSLVDGSIVESLGGPRGVQGRLLNQGTLKNA